MSLRLIFKRYQSYSLSKFSNLEELKLNTSDFKGLFKYSTLNELYFQRGEKIVNELNLQLIENKISPPSSLNELIKLTINKPELIKIYNNATSLQNLNFFFENLKESSDYSFPVIDSNEILKSPILEDLEEVNNNFNIDKDLKDWIISSFGSILQFKSLLLNSAHSINGNGITWLISQPRNDESLKFSSFSSNFGNKDKLSIVNTYNNGTIDDSLRSNQLYKNQKQKELKENLKLEKEPEQQEVVEEEFNPILGTIEEAEFQNLFNEKSIIPLLAIDASPRNYLKDYGVFGNQRYLDNVWKCINWDIVKQRTPKKDSQNFSFDYE
ncbi:37S ribosomal protein Mrp1p, mitochondrial [[Candida] jaroonii]|uniref:37S ribosomal protein Mrp1p, mitochondrial n=1 Tax=[Candida] jaroonii TaxID=467808 RepID=A0ACA9Y5D8_9ASCO|nr:37S ribosomal protein Mrp1p, mitochondrial [[Candida] jaroonii]